MKPRTLQSILSASLLLALLIPSPASANLVDGAALPRTGSADQAKPEKDEHSSKKKSHEAKGKGSDHDAHADSGESTSDAEDNDLGETNDDRNEAGMKNDIEDDGHAGPARKDRSVEDGTVANEDKAGSGADKVDGSQGINLPCPSGTTTFKIDRNPTDGTYSDGTLTVTISGNDGDSFSWSSNLSITAVLVKGGTATKVNSGGTSGSASTASNPNSGDLYDISHVAFCYAPAVVAGDTEKRCPAGTDNAGAIMDDVNDCDEDDVRDRSDKVCPEGTDKAGQSMTGMTKADCDEDGFVLGTLIRNAGVLGRGLTATAAGIGAVLPFTGTGDLTAFLAIAALLVGAGIMLMRSKRTTS